MFLVSRTDSAVHSPFLNEISYSSTDLISDAIQIAKIVSRNVYSNENREPTLFSENARQILINLISYFMKIIPACVFAEKWKM
jgi:hypothetical protein